MHLPTAFLTLLAALAAGTSDRRPCGLKIAPCPSGETCLRRDPSCTRGENCLGYCAAVATSTNVTTTITATAAPTKTLTTLTTKTTKQPRPTYPSCGGFRIQPRNCAEDEICIDDPYSGGCGMACDAPGICVKPVFCGGFAGFRCADGRRCIEDPRDDCDPKRGGADCGGLCV
ncbi:hypothetical protein B0T25DRAFT_496385 [Lasiosphaeria hispida]|uniref:Uncharacterized protein n=1 Tax=Lasiosphaeria hispida TaxID=260671 RepID=A0AAJ0HSE9_9PEZI|nr:hypothetical protein B0T25DRAFT_496385 [Lasiosphaeria hispida]